MWGLSGYSLTGMCLWDPFASYFSRRKIFPEMFCEESGPWQNTGGLWVIKQGRGEPAGCSWWSPPALSWDMLMLSRGARGPPDPSILSKSSAIISCVGAGVQGREELMNGRANNNLILQHSGSFGLMNWLLLTGNPTDLQVQFDDLAYSQVPCCL